MFQFFVEYENFLNVGLHDFNFSEATVINSCRKFRSLFDLSLRYLVLVYNFVIYSLDFR